MRGHDAEGLELRLTALHPRALPYSRQYYDARINSSHVLVMKSIGIDRRPTRNLTTQL